MFDSHCHLDFPELDDGRDVQIAQGLSCGIEQWFVPGCTPSQWPRVRQLRAHAEVLVGYGIHPWWACDAHRSDTRTLDQTMSALRQALLHDGAVALGECGLDRVREAEVPLAVQVPVFEAQLALARELSLPLVLHEVRAREPFLRCLDRVGLSPAGGVIHGFSGDSVWAQTLLHRGLLLGIGPALLRRGREKLRFAAASADLSRLLVETDAPDQGIDGQRGRLIDLVAVVAELARLRQTEATPIARQTAFNARLLFGQRAPR